MKKKFYTDLAFKANSSKIFEMLPFSRTLRDKVEKKAVEYYLNRNEDSLVFSLDNISLKGFDSSDFYHYLREEPYYEVFVSECRSAETVVDVGSHIGFYGLSAASLGCKVTCIESDLIPLERADKLAELNGFQEKMEFINAVCSDESSKYKSRIDDLDFQDLDLIKIDVQGAELKVLRGAKESLKDHQPELFVEIHDEVGLSDVKEILDGLGYGLSQSFKRGDDRLTHFEPEGMPNE